MSSLSFKSAVAMLFSIAPTLGTIGSVGLLSTGSKTPISTKSSETKKRQKRDIGQAVEETVSKLADLAESAVSDLHASQDSLYKSQVTSIRLVDTLSTLKDELTGLSSKQYRASTSSSLSNPSTIDDSVSTTPSSSLSDISWEGSAAGTFPDISTEDTITSGWNDDGTEQSDSGESVEELEQSSESKEQMYEKVEFSSQLESSNSSSTQQISTPMPQQSDTQPESSSSSSGSCSTQTREDSQTTVCFERLQSDALSTPESLKSETVETTPKKVKRSAQKDKQDTYVYWKGLWQFLRSFWKAFTSTDRLRAF